MHIHHYNREKKSPGVLMHNICHYTMREEESHGMMKQMEN